jgi:hypothetical protein
MRKSLALLLLLALPALADVRENATLRVRRIQTTRDGHLYTLLQPMLPVTLGAWVETSETVIKEHEVLQCKVVEKKYPFNDKVIVTLLLDCGRVTYRLDTVWFTEPAE